MTNTQIKREDTIDLAEFQGMIARGNTLKYPHQYYRLRDLAIICILRKTGKRRVELTRIKRAHITVIDNHMVITFYVAKKRTNNPLGQRREKKISLADTFVKPIQDYIAWLDENEPNGEYLFPHTSYSPFGNRLHIDNSKPTDGRTLLRSVKKLNPNAWCHLFRESVAADIIRRDPSILAVFRVKKRLDLESHLTAFKYMERFASDVIESEGDEDTIESA